MGEKWSNDNTAVLFFEKDKQSDKHPDLKGSADPLCSHCNKTTSFWVSAWKNKMKSTGDPYLSLSLTAKDTSFAKPKAEPVAAPVASAEPNDDIPF